jgi:hypothetical protein
LNRLKLLEAGVQLFLAEVLVAAPRLGVEPIGCRGSRAGEAIAARGSGRAPCLGLPHDRVYLGILRIGRLAPILGLLAELNQPVQVRIRDPR